MSWSITVNKPLDIPNLNKFHEEFATINPMYPIDMELALNVAKSLGLGSATLAGGRTPMIYSADEVVMISVTGSANATDFLATMQEEIKHGPAEDTPVARHNDAVLRLELNPCQHDFFRATKHEEYQCKHCGVFMHHGGMLYFDA